MLNKNKMTHLIASMLIGVAFILIVIMLLIFTGVIGASQTALVISTGSAEALYDGTTLTEHSWQIESGELKKGHQIQAVFRGEQKGVGESKNIAEVIITDELGADVTSDYRVTYKYGNLTVDPRVIRIVSADAHKDYDGTPLRSNQYEVEANYTPLAPGDRLNVNITGEITEVGETANTVESITVVDASGRDVTNNYRYTASEGRLRIDPKIVNLTITTLSGEKVYDGSPLTVPRYNITRGSLKYGHQLIPVVSGSQTNVGESENTIDVRIVDESGNDVMEQYNILYNLGLLQVNPRPIRIETADASKAYDKKPLTNKNYALTSGTASLVSGHRLNVNITGTITDPGEKPNTVGSVKVLAADGTDVSRNYQITIKEGTLTVLGQGDTETMIGGVGLEEMEEQKVLDLYSTKSGLVYLREKSYGDYTGRGWTDGVKYTKLLNNAYCYNYLAGVALESSGVEPSEIKIKLAMPVYPIPYYPALAKGDYTVQTNDVLYAGKDEEYSLSIYFADQYKTAYSGHLDQYSDEEMEYRKFVYDNYLKVDDQTRTYMLKLIKAQGFDKTDPYVIYKAARYLQKSATYNLGYNRALDQESNIVIAFLDRYKEGICQHYASAGVMLFRSLGIPARYTVGFVERAVEDEWVEVMTPGHAWVEVYIDAFGWVPVEVTGSSGEEPWGEVEVEVHAPKMQLELTPITVEKQYDGTPLYAKNQVTGMEELTKMGFTYQVQIQGERTEVGKSVSLIQSCSVYDKKGNNVTNQLDLIFLPGVVHVYEQELYFQSLNQKKTYDGRMTVSANLVKNKLIPGHSYEIVTTATPDAGTKVALYDVIIKDASGNDVTDHYKVNKLYGTLEISPRLVTIAAESANKVYDGTALTCNRYKITLGTLAPQQYVLDYTITGSLTQPGRCENILSDIMIVNEDGEDVTHNYQITLQPGTLRVTLK